MPVIAADTFDDEIATGHRPGETDGAHGGFGTAVDESHHLNGGQCGGDGGGELSFSLGWRTVTGTAPDRFGERGHDALIRMPDNHRPVTSDVVDVFIAIEIRDKAAFGPLNEQRPSTHGFVCSHWRGNTARHDLTCFEKGGFRIGGDAFRFRHAQNVCRDTANVKAGRGLTVKTKNPGRGRASRTRVGGESENRDALMSFLKPFRVFISSI